MESLKVEVERIVHPLKARESQKDVFREELWGHLAALYQEESGKTRNANGVLAAALQRLGEAELLRATFMDSLSLVDRLEGWLMCFMEPKSGNGFLRHTLSMAACVFIPPWLCFMAFLLATFPLPGMDAGTYAVAVVTYTLALFVLAAYATLSVTEAQRAKTALRNAGGQCSARVGRRFATAMLIIGGVAPLACLGGHLFLSWVLAMLGQHELLNVYYFFCTEFLALLCVSLSVLAATLVYGAAWRARHNGPLCDWPYAGSR